MLIAAAEEELGGADRAGGDHDDARAHRPALKLPVEDSIEPNLISAIVARIDMTDDVKRPNFRSVLLRPRNIVQVQGISGLDRAAEIALAEVDTRTLLNSLGVRPPGGVPGIGFPG